jgi:hypothetical protein
MDPSLRSEPRVQKLWITRQSQSSQHSMPCFWALWPTAGEIPGTQECGHNSSGENFALSRLYASAAQNGGPGATRGDRGGFWGWSSRTQKAVLDDLVAAFNRVDRSLKQAPESGERIGVERGFHPDMVR